MHKRQKKSLKGKKPKKNALTVTKLIHKNYINCTKLHFIIYLLSFIVYL